MFGVPRRTRGAHNLLGANMRKRAFDTEEVYGRGGFYYFKGQDSNRGQFK